eukprot:CAMPEP_0204585944 /NCGR_PEP_ID=MMETSP0661-20131031/47207_1 /ASSEMBLY_ACC=CAM_ASM_000606 /TAXON_ID=109239 /ORGANISM="Alexandrium margalefi, Strain AMGDE01CS-322" /LENGTH=72 /DNA_ID=CAMNT_0051595539 /DNA_START=43 /DNA_END=257 /DNA_ORIENTATION=+
MPYARVGVCIDARRHECHPPACGWGRRQEDIRANKQPRKEAGKRRAGKCAASGAHDARTRRRAPTGTQAHAA